MVSQTVNQEILTPVSFLKRSARVFRDRVAVVFGAQRYTYGQFADRVCRLAGALDQLGVKAQDKVLFFSPNTPPLLEAHFAVPMIGAVLVCVDTQLYGDDLAYILAHSEARLLFVDQTLVARARAVLSEVPAIEQVVVMNQGCDPDGAEHGLSYEQLVTAAPAMEMTNAAIGDEQQPITINYTSGTTGRPKGVMCSHRATYLHALGEVIESSLRSDSVYLWTLPMFHCNGWGYTWAVTAVGGTHVCLHHPDPDRIVQCIAQEKVTHLCAAPPVLQRLIADPQAQRLRLRRRLRILTAGSSPSPAIIQGLEAIGADVIHVYGLTELHGPHCICTWQASWVEYDPQQVARMKSRQGVASITALHMEVVDPATMLPVPWDGQTIGEVVMRGNNVMLGYYKDPEATARAFAHGWFHSGDLAVVHSDGYIQVVDRMGDTITRGGDLLSSMEIEETINHHPDVLETAVVAAPDPLLGEVPKAFVVLKEGHQTTAADIIAFCRQQRGASGVPHSVEFCQLPKTATGKTIKARLRHRTGPEFRVEADNIL